MEKGFKTHFTKTVVWVWPRNIGIVFTERFHSDIIERYNRLMIFDKAHNEYLNIAVTTGIPSLMVYLYFISNIIMKAIRGVSKNIMIIPLLCSVIGYLVQAFFNISVVSVAYVYWIMLGILLNMSTESTEIELENAQNRGY